MGRRKPGKPRRNKPDDLPEILDWGRAVRMVAGQIAGRRHFSVIFGPGALSELSRRLAGVTGWTAYVHASHGDRDVVFSTTRWADLAGWDVHMPALLGVVTMPKSPRAAAQLTAALGAGVDCGERDQITLTPDGSRTFWPGLVLDALEQVDPAAAATIYLEKDDRS